MLAYGLSERLAHKRQLNQRLTATLAADVS